MGRMAPNCLPKVCRSDLAAFHAPHVGEALRSTATFPAIHCRSQPAVCICTVGRSLQVRCPPAAQHLQRHLVSVAHCWRIEVEAALDDQQRCRRQQPQPAAAGWRRAQRRPSSRPTPHSGRSSGALGSAARVRDTTMGSAGGAPAGWGQHTAGATAARLPPTQTAHMPPCLALLLQCAPRRWQPPASLTWAM
jgi:hypothetical protein